MKIKIIMSKPDWYIEEKFYELYQKLLSMYSELELNIIHDSQFKEDSEE